MNQKKKLVLHQETLRNLVVSSGSKPRKDTLIFCNTDRTCPDMFTASECTNCLRVGV